jgi:RNA methyltransferase, TrmH family
MKLIERFHRARRDPTLAVLEGFHPLKHALRFGAVIEFVVASPDTSVLRSAAERLAPDLADQVSAIEATSVEPAHFEELTPARPAERVLAIARRTVVDAERVASAGDGLVVLLESPSHLPNIGAVVRVAAAAGCAAVLTTGPHDPWHASALRGSAGLHYALPVARIESLSHTRRPIVALDPGGEPLRPGLLPDDALLVFGTERHGLSAELRERATLRVGIPMRAGVSSLSLATAVAITLYAGQHAGR